MEDARKMKECSLLISKAVSSFPFCPSLIYNAYTETATGDVLWKKHSQKFHKIHRKTSLLELTQVFPCEFREIFKKTYCEEQLWMTSYAYTQPAFTCSNLTIETLEQGV